MRSRVLGGDDPYCCAAAMMRSVMRSLSRASSIEVTSGTLRPRTRSMKCELDSRSAPSPGCGALATASLLAPRHVHRPRPSSRIPPRNAERSSGCPRPRGLRQWCRANPPTTFAGARSGTNQLHSSNPTAPEANSTVANTASGFVRPVNDRSTAWTAEHFDSLARSLAIFRLATRVAGPPPSASHPASSSRSDSRSRPAWTP